MQGVTEFIQRSGKGIFQPFFSNVFLKPQHYSIGSTTPDHRNDSLQTFLHFDPLVDVTTEEASAPSPKCGLTPLLILVAMEAWIQMEKIFKPPLNPHPHSF